MYQISVKEIVRGSLHSALHQHSNGGKTTTNANIIAVGVSAVVSKSLLHMTLFNLLKGDVTHFD